MTAIVSDTYVTELLDLLAQGEIEEVKRILEEKEKRILGPERSALCRAKR